MISRILFILMEGQLRFHHLCCKQHHFASLEVSNSWCNSMHANIVGKCFMNSRLKPFGLWGSIKKNKIRLNFFFVWIFFRIIFRMKKTHYGNRLRKPFGTILPSCLSGFQESPKLGPNKEEMHSPFGRLCAWSL